VTLVGGKVVRAVLVILIVLSVMAVVAAASWRTGGEWSPAGPPATAGPAEVAPVRGVPPAVRAPDPHAEACLVPDDDALTARLFRGDLTGAGYRAAIEALAAREAAHRPYRVN
jgi:hypothetical protein